MHVGLRITHVPTASLIAFATAPIAAQAFGPQQVVTQATDGPEWAIAADLDGDGDQDVISTSYVDNKLAWYANTDSKGTFGPQQTFTSTAYAPNTVFAADVDGDGDQDVFSASIVDDQIAWYENTDGQGTFGQHQVIASMLDGPRSVFSADLDGDGDQDALLASIGDNRIAWYENTDGLGAFGPQQTITTAAHYAWCVFAADLDGDGDRDVLSASLSDDEIAWYENTDGLGSFGPQQIITNAADRARSVFAADLDGDGDQDVLSASANDSKIAWYENSDGLGAFGTQQVITTMASEANSVSAADLDGDGDRDVLSTSPHDDKVAWYENTDGKGSFGPQQVISTTSNSPRLAFPVNLDGDGDQDVLVASYLDDKISWYENLMDSPLATDVDTISLAIGGKQNLFLTAGMAHDLETYFLLGTLNGTSPGVLVDGFVLPLFPDGYFYFTLLNPNSAALTDTYGTLDTSGKAAAALTLQAGMNPAFAGIVAHHAYAVFDLTTTPGQPFVSFVSNAVPLTLSP